MPSAVEAHNASTGLLCVCVYVCVYGVNLIRCDVPAKSTNNTKKLISNTSPNGETAANRVSPQKREMEMAKQLPMWLHRRVTRGRRNRKSTAIRGGYLGGSACLFMDVYKMYKRNAERREAKHKQIEISFPLKRKESNACSAPRSHPLTTGVQTSILFL
eukprot:gene3733-2630_t